MSLGVVSIDHVQITVPRALERECLVFYRDVLGLTEIAKPAELKTRGGAWFQLANLQLHIGIDAEPSPPGRRHVCFLVTDIEEARSCARAAGLDVGEQAAADGLRRFFLRDPGGNRLEIGQR